LVRQTKQTKALATGINSKRLIGGRGEERNGWSY